MRKPTLDQPSALPSGADELLYRVSELKQKCRELADALYDANYTAAQCRADAAAHELHKAIGCIEEIEREARYNKKLSDTGPLGNQ